MAKKIDLDGYTNEDLQELLRRATTVLNDRVKAEREEKLKVLQEIAKEAGYKFDPKTKAFVVSDGNQPSLRAKRVAQSYRNPETGAVWSGFGRKPQWLLDAIGSGKLMVDFKV